MTITTLSSRSCKITRTHNINININDVRHRQQISNLLVISGHALIKLNAHEHMRWPASVCNEHRDPPQGAIFRTWFESHVLPAFAGRILPVDTAVAQRCAALHVPDPRPAMDSLIAATALVHGMTLVTRNVADFLSSGVAILNPWETPENR